jgi:hypothetical protein
MILPVYLVRKFFKAFIICTMSSYSIFFIFSLMGNLGEKLSFKSIFFLSILNSFQIFTYIPSHLFIFSLCLFVFNLKSKNELIIIKEYIDLKKLFLIIFPILVLFIFTEIKKDNLLNVIEQIKSNVINSKKIDDTKIIILFEGNKKKYTILKGYDQDNLVINQYLSFESQNSKIDRAEISNNLYLTGNDLFSNESTVYEKNNFQYENFNKKLLENFIRFWAENTVTKINYKKNNVASNYHIIQSILFICLFYICISMIFLSKKLVNRGMNIIKFFLILISIFLYFLLVPKIILSNFQYLFQLITIIIFILIFFKIKQYE